MVMPQPDTTGRFPHRALAVAILAFAVVLSSLFPFAGRHKPLARSVHAQEQPPVIHSVDPEPPHCVLRNSEIEAQRILTITGENLQFVEGRHLQFLLIGVGQDSLLIGAEVDWESADRITVDMNRAAVRRLARALRVSGLVGFNGQELENSDHQWIE